MGKWLKNSVMAVLLLMFIGGLGMSGYKLLRAEEGQIAYEEAEEIANPPVPLAELPEPAAIEEPAENGGWREAEVTGDPFMDELRQTDLAALQEVNEDVIGWIVIPDTKLEYPILFSGDNEFYLNHTWEKEASSAGSIFLEQSNTPDLTDFHTILYGHRMLNGSMFASLKYYDRQEHFEQHPYVYLFDEAGAHRYEIFAAYEAAVVSRTYQLGFPDEESRQAFLDSCMERSVIDTGVTPTVRDRILTLSTCTGKGYESRWVVQARLAAAEETSG